MHGYSFRRYPLDHVFAMARRLGWDGIELVRFHFDEERVEEEVGAAVALGARYGVPVGCVGYCGQFTDDDVDLREHSIDLAERAIRACERHGIPQVNGWAGALVRDPGDWRRNGSAAASEVHYDRAASAYRRLGKLASECGVTVCVETHMNAVHDTIAGTARLLDLVDEPAVKVTPDPSNFYIHSEAERDPAVLDALAGRIGYFHVKNCLPGTGQVSFTVDTAYGVVDNFAWLAKLTAVGGVPRLAVEYCGEGDPHPVLAAAPGYVRGCLDLAAAPGSPAPAPGQGER
jgi:sugar phosphate isomerase/epimerase